MYHLPLDHHNHLALGPDHYDHAETYHTRDHSLETESGHASRAQRGRHRSFSILRALPAQFLRNGGKP
jgi:hypothetical protein